MMNEAYCFFFYFFFYFFYFLKCTDCGFIYFKMTNNSYYPTQSSFLSETFLLHHYEDIE